MVFSYVNKLHKTFFHSLILFLSKHQNILDILVSELDDSIRDVNRRRRFCAKWRMAMDAEIDAIERNDTWELTCLPTDAKKVRVK